MPIAQRRSSSGSATADANTATENMESTTRLSSVSSSAEIPFARALKRSTSFATARAREVRDPCPNVGIQRALSLHNIEWWCRQLPSPPHSENECPRCCEIMKVRGRMCRARRRSSTSVPFARSSATI